MRKVVQQGWLHRKYKDVLGRAEVHGCEHLLEAALAWSIEMACGVHNRYEVIRNILAVVHRIPEDGFRDVEEAYVQEVLDSHAADLTEEGFEQLTVLGEPGDEECASVGRKASDGSSLVVIFF